MLQNTLPSQPLRNCSNVFDAMKTRIKYPALTTCMALISLEQFSLSEFVIQLLSRCGSKKRTDDAGVVRYPMMEINTMKLQDTLTASVVCRCSDEICSEL